MLHQQTSMCSPISPILGTQNLIDSPSNQLLRSKSLNDISNSSLVPATDLSINFQGLQQQQQNQRQTSNNILHNIGPNLIASYGTQKQFTTGASSMLGQTSNGTTCSMSMANNYDQCDIYQQQHNPNSLRTTTPSSNNHAFNHHLVNDQFNQQPSTFYLDPNDSQCSTNNKQHNISVTNSTAPTNMFNICNPIVMNLNGVTEQIGNLHL
jgi:hypothetical protein